MAILSQQQVTTFPISDGELELWQPEGATHRESRDNDGPGPTGPLVQIDIPAETCPWTNDMVGELWVAIISENNSEMDLIAGEIQGWNDLEELVEGQLIDIYEPSYFNEWNQSIGRVAFVCDARGIAQKFTPEMLVQRDNLNDMWNANCQLEDENPLLSKIWGGAPIDYVPDSHCTLEFVSIGEKFGVAKCEYGSTFVPKSSIKHIKNLLGREPTVGQMFGAWIAFEGGAKYPWRIEGTIGVTEAY